MRRIAAILCSAAILASYPGIAALGQEPEIAIPVGAGVSGSSLFGQEEGWSGMQAAGDAGVGGRGRIGSGGMLGGTWKMNVRIAALRQEPGDVRVAGDGWTGEDVQTAGDADGRCAVRRWREMSGSACGPESGSCPDSRSISHSHGSIYRTGNL